ncbi:hypothetical protein PMAYCL1PPCAC_20437, partial [Pristionchus mayeri]
KDAVIGAIDNVTLFQLEAAVARILSNISISCVGNIDNVPSRSEIHNWISPSTTIHDLSTSPLPSSNNDRLDPELITTPEKRPLYPDVIRNIYSRDSPLVQEQLTKLPSGLIVASSMHNELHNNVYLALTYRAGARYESGSKQKGLAFLVSKILSINAKGIGSESGQPGSKFVGMAPQITPDFLTMRVTVPRKKSMLALEYLGRIATLKDWELNELIKEVADGGGAPPPARLIVEYVRRAAYGNGPLANTLREKISLLRHTDEDVRNFAATHMVASNAVLYAINFDHDELCKFGEEYIPTSKVPTPRAPPSPYVGGEVEHKKQFESVYVCIAGAGAALEDVQACATQAVLMAWLGKQVARPDKNVLNQGRLVGVAKWFNTPSSVTCSAMYFEGEGLIQFNIEATPSCVRSMARDVVNILKNFKVDDFEISKNRAKHNILRAEDSRQARFAAVERTIQIFTGVEKDAVLKAIDNVTASQLEAAVERILSNISIGCIGNIDNVPYREEIQSWVK